MHGLDRPDHPPAAARWRSAGPTFSVQHGVELVDEYAWLRADNWQEVMRDPVRCSIREIRAYLEAENAYTEAALADTRDLQEALYAEMKAPHQGGRQLGPGARRRLRVLRELRHRRPVSAPVPAAARRRRRGRSCSTATRRPRASAYWQLGAAAHSPDHQLLAYAVDEKGSELFTIRIRDLATGQDLPDAIPDTRSAIVWARDSRTLFYVRLDANQRPLYVYRHRVGTPGEDDVLVYEEKDIGLLRRRRPDPVGRASSPSMPTTTRRARST